MGGAEEALRRARRLLERFTRRYYSRATPPLPEDYLLREFAAQTWWGKAYIRHMAFSSEDQVASFLRSKAPRHFYYSSARYRRPEAPSMDEKEWISSDLVFDIDADHLPECSGLKAELSSPLTGEKTVLVDDSCVARAGLRARILYDVLVYELGVEERRIVVEFSGHRGFHVTAYLPRDDPLARSGSDVRREIVNYVKASGLLEETLEPWRRIAGRTRGRPEPLPPSPREAGLRGRLARAEALARRLGLGDVDPRSLVSVGVDEQVTVDTSRLIRAPRSLHGKTMLPVLPVEPDEACTYRPAAAASPFEAEDPIRVEMHAEIPSSLRILGHRARLRRGEKPRLPAPLALYFLAKGLASPAE